MNTIIRNSIWQTNSSSMHSLSINTSARLRFSTIPLDRNGNIVVTAKNMDEFDVDQNSKHNLTKLQYLISYVMSQTGYDDQDEQKKQATQSRLLMIRNVVLQHTGANKLIIKGKNRYDYMSIGGTQSFLDDVLQCRQRIKQFIFTGKYRLSVIPE